MFQMDGTQWEFPIDVERTAEMEASEISGLMLDRSYFNDVIGTYVQYDIRLEVPFGYEAEYNEFFEALTEPVEGHNFVLPYAGGTRTIWGRVDNIKDIYVRYVDRKTKEPRIHWRGIKFSVTSNHPIRQVNEDGSFTARGVPPLPDESSLNIGACYVYGASGWEELEDAEDSEY